ncbi:MAG TPA: hypothetical protein VK582_00985 [Pyrinomonadaceae bacterium]|nr:hypothetical protein [Pyrinomonadaceae bacterium]
MTPDNISILSQVKSLEAQLGAIKARLLRSKNLDDPSQPFALLYGRLAGQSDSTEEEIDAILYQTPHQLEEAG